MKPGALMWLGALAAMVAFAASLVLPSQPIVLAFAAGALFGKGYGIWEERTRREEERHNVSD